MFCQHCGSKMADTAATCPQCAFPNAFRVTSSSGAPVFSGGAAAPATDLGQDAGMRLLLPVGRSVLAIVAGYLGLISVLVFPAPFALIVGVLAIVDIRRHPEKHGLGRAIFGIVMGAAVLLLLLVVLIYAWADSAN